MLAASTTAGDYDVRCFISSSGSGGGGGRGPYPYLVSHKKMAAIGSCIDFMFLGLAIPSRWIC